MFGNILEWYQVYSYVYLAPVLAKTFFHFESPDSNLLSAFILFGIGFLTRPLGGLIFGRWGDKRGRKSAFIGSILVMTIPTFAMGCLSPYAKWGVLAPILLILLRLIQSLPESGESPGSACFLYENAEQGNKVFMTSWAPIGNQIGAILGVFEALILDQHMSEEFLLSWGWRISFWSGGILGLLGFFLRRTLDETPIFKELVAHNKVDTETFFEVINNHKRKILLGTGCGVINATTFYLIAAYIPNYLDIQLGLTVHQNAFISLAILVIMTVLLPFFGMLGERWGVKPLFAGSVLLIIALLPVLYFSVKNDNIGMILVVGFIYILPVSCITALISYVLVHLFSAPIRFTGVALSFNLADGLVGGFTPAIAIALMYYVHNQAAFCLFVFVSAVISLISCLKIKN